MCVGKLLLPYVYSVRFKHRFNWEKSRRKWSHLKRMIMRTEGCEEDRSKGTLKVKVRKSERTTQQINNNHPWNVDKHHKLKTQAVMICQCHNPLMTNKSNRLKKRLKSNNAAVAYLQSAFVHLICILKGKFPFTFRDLTESHWSLVLAKKS